MLPLIAVYGGQLSALVYSEHSRGHTLMGAMIIQVLLVLVGTRLAMYCVMEWKLLRVKRTVASSGMSRWERFLLASLPLIAVLAAVLVVSSAMAVVRILSSSGI